MSLIRNRRCFLRALFSALLALALFDPGAATAQEVKQIKLTEKNIQGFMAAYDDIAKLYDGANPDKRDPKVDAQAAAVAKKNGFASLAQYEDVSTNITMIMFGIDPQTKKFTEPPEQIKNEIAALKADKSVPEAEKKEGLAQLEAALKIAKPIQFKENIALVLLCHKFRCLFRAAQHGQRESVVARAATNLRRIVAIEFGTWRSGRNGGSSGLVTFAYGNLRAQRGGTIS